MELNNNFILKEVAGEIMLVYQNEKTVDFSKVITLNEIGKEIYLLIKEGKEENEIVSSLLLEYEVRKEVLKKDVHDFIKKLKELKIIND